MHLRFTIHMISYSILAKFVKQKMHDSIHVRAQSTKHVRAKAFKARKSIITAERKNIKNP